ncbi:Transcriptional regulator [Lunasporangiospora selenospora]|uniref:Transcriptional regulator n=1 Tax=Lunasporangiospora selenospora TaxID=979761 RepID=A0A9P6FUX6_9FUNG|nr:Transcriptional regulator [Lunasporangiospora selenospora]
MDSSSVSTPTLDPNALTYRTYVNRIQSSSTPSIPVLPSYSELAALQQELQLLSDNANSRLEKYSNELARLEGVPEYAGLLAVRDVGLARYLIGTTTLAFPPQCGNAPLAATKPGTSPNTSSPSSISGNSRSGGSSGAIGSGSSAAGPSSSSKPGVVTLKLKRSDVLDASKMESDQNLGSGSNTVKIRTGTPSIAQEGFLKKKKKRELDEDSEYSEDDRAPHAKAKRSDEFSLGKVGRSMSPQPTKLNSSRHSAPKASQGRMGDKSQAGSQQKKKKNSEQFTEKSKPAPKSQEVQDDFSKVKVANQIPIQTFWASMDPYFRLFTESDRLVLEEEGDQVTPLLIPPLGKHYLDVWAEEERTLLPFDGSYGSRRNSVDSTKEPSQSRNYVNNTPFELTDENIEQEDISCGPLTERIISSLILEDVVDPKELKTDEDQPDPAPIVHQSNPRNYAELEERIKRELRYIGLLGNEEIDWDAREDDEISIKLRSLQKQLRDVMKVNKDRKQKLLNLVNDHLAYQEYNTILDDLDKQVEQGYLKRFRMTKSKKKKTSTPKALSENALSAMDRRKRFVQGIGPIFPAEKYTIPTTTIYTDELTQGKDMSSTPQTYRQLNGLP